jgi:predicted ATPase/class 3 adenylate cyclase
MRFVFGDCVLDIERYELRRAGQVVALEPRAFRVLAYLLQHAGRAVSKQALVQACWPGPSSEAISQEYALRNCLTKIRQAVGDTGVQQAMIETVRGYGYRATAAVTVFPPDARAADTVPPDPVHSPTPPAPSEPSQALPGRRQLTVLRCTLVEEPSWARWDPEDMRMVLQALYTACEEVMQRVDGYIAQYDSAGLLVYFGYPMAHEAAAPRAVRAGLMLVEAVKRLKVRGAADKPIRLAVRLGIHTGLVVVDAPGTGRRQDPVALGDPPQVAARLQERAAPNTVVVSDATWRLVQDSFAGHVLEPQALAGVAAPVQAYQVLGTTGAQSRLDVVPLRGLTPLVGREEERALLRARWAQARNGLGQVVVLSGEPGIGKSRLVHALHEHLAAEPHVRVEWRCLPDAQQSPLQPVIAHVHRLLRWRPEAPPEATLRTLEATLASYGLALPEVVPLLAALLSLPLPAHYPPLALTPQRQRHKTLEALLAWLLAEATRQPVLFIVEDLHWSDPSTLEFLTLLLDQGPTARLLTLLTCRPEFTVPWSFRAHCTPLTLSRLPQAQVAEMIGRVAGDNALPPEVVTQIAAQTDGVPLFIEELTKMVLESDLLQEDEDRDALPEPLLSLAIPATLHDSLMARLDRLGPVKAVAQLGATIGRTFAYDLLQAVAALDEAALQQGLRQLVETELVYQRGIPPQATYTFKHALIQDTAYASMLRSTRQQVHQEIARVLETQLPETMETQPELVAHHYTEANLPDHAIDYWQRAGQRAISRSAYAEAIAHLTKALDVLTTLADASKRNQYELDVQLALGQALIFIKGQADAEVGQAYHRARALCLQMGDDRQLFRILYGLAHFHTVRAELQTARALSEELLRLAQRIDDPIYLHGAHWVMGAMGLLRGEFSLAREHWEQSFALYDPQQHQNNVFLFGFDLGIFSLCWLPHALWHLGYPEQALSVAQQALDVADALSHASSRAVALDYVTMLHQFRRDKPAAHEQTDAAISLCTEQGFAYYLAWARLMQGWSLTLPGQGEAGIPQMRDGLEALRATGGQLRLPYYLSLMAEAYGQAGQIEEGLSLLDEALALVEKTGERWRMAELYRLKGDLLLQQDVPDVSQAEGYFHQALDLARHQQAKALELRTAIRLGGLWHQQGKCYEARGMLTDITSWFTEGLNTVDLQEAKVLLDELSAESRSSTA